MSFINLFVFCLFFVALWFFIFDPGMAESLGLGRAQLEMIMLQSVSFLLVLCAVQMPSKAAEGWRPALLTLSFVALSESSLVALLTPITG
ncbi:MAG: hypothetical protein KC800_05315 [Candidatus Eremiobacteraeota bacterium]|nr:hypothetical protein [Candidatus Eremiobacteraeota bacterium]